MLGFIGKWASSKGMGRIPDLDGLSLNDARTAITNAGFNLGSEYSLGNSEGATSANNGKAKRRSDTDSLLEYESVLNFEYYSYTSVPVPSPTPPTPTPPSPTPPSPTPPSPTPPTTYNIYSYCDPLIVGLRGGAYGVQSAGPTVNVGTTSNPNLTSEQIVAQLGYGSGCPSVPVSNPGTVYISYCYQGSPLQESYTVDANNILVQDINQACSVYTSTLAGIGATNIACSTVSQPAAPSCSTSPTPPSPTPPSPTPPSPTPPSPTPPSPTPSTPTSYYVSGCCSTSGLVQGSSNVSFANALDNMEGACPTGVVTNTLQSNSGYPAQSCSTPTPTPSTPTPSGCTISSPCGISGCCPYGEGTEACVTDSGADGTRTYCLTPNGCINLYGPCVANGGSTPSPSPTPTPTPSTPTPSTPTPSTPTPSTPTPSTPTPATPGGCVPGDLCNSVWVGECIDFYVYNASCGCEFSGRLC